MNTLSTENSERNGVQPANEPLAAGINGRTTEGH